MKDNKKPGVGQRMGNFPPDIDRIGELFYIYSGPADSISNKLSISSDDPYLENAAKYAPLDMKESKRFGLLTYFTSVH